MAQLVECRLWILAQVMISGFLRQSPLCWQRRACLGFSLTLSVPPPVTRMLARSLSLSLKINLKKKVNFWLILVIKDTLFDDFVVNCGCRTDNMKSTRDIFFPHEIQFWHLVAFFSDLDQTRNRTNMSMVRVTGMEIEGWQTDCIASRDTTTKMYESKSHLSKSHQHKQF